MTAAVIVVALALLALLVYGVAKSGTGDPIATALARGERVPAPQRALALLDGSGRRSLADYRGKVVVLNYWASWCGPCAEEAPVLVGFQRAYAGRGVVVLGVVYDDSVAAARAFERRHGIDYPSLRDTDTRLFDDLHNRGVPETFVIDRQGRIAALRRNQVDRAWLERAVAPLLGARS